MRNTLLGFLLSSLIVGAYVGCGSIQGTCDEGGIGGGGFGGGYETVDCLDGSATGDSRNDGNLADSTVSDGAFVLPDGAVVLEDGAVLLPDGAVVRPDGAVINPTTDGGSRGTPLPDGGLLGCVPGLTACTNCKDDDGDGLTDFLDPECTGSLDNDEASFATGIPGDNIDCKQDCFFDGNSGAGDDRCEWNPQCDPLYPGYTKNGKIVCEYDSKKAENPNVCPPGQPQSQQCKNFCAPLTPNGCDCFGCCDIFSAQGTLLKTVSLRDGCSLSTLNDPGKCVTCTKSTACVNDCQKCELCLGKTQLPAECIPDAGVGPGPGGDSGTPTTDSGVPVTPGVPGQVCSGGQISCNAEYPCPNGKVCITGCCFTDLQ